MPKPVDTEILDLDAIVPDDIEIKRQGKSYYIPGDLDSQSTFELFKLFRRLAAAEERGKDTELEKAITDVEKTLLKLLQIRQPDLTEFPFGVASLSHILLLVLRRLGVIAEIAADSDDPTPPTPPKKMAASVRSRSSSRSRRSAKSSTSPRKKS